MNMPLLGARLHTSEWIRENTTLALELDCEDGCYDFLQEYTFHNKCFYLKETIYKGTMWMDVPTFATTTIIANQLFREQAMQFCAESIHPHSTIFDA